MKEQKPAYIVVRGYYLQTLTKLVNERMAEGYVPTGGVFAFQIVVDDPWCQAMVLSPPTAGGES